MKNLLVFGWWTGAHRVCVWDLKPGREMRFMGHLPSLCQINKFILITNTNHLMLNVNQSINQDLYVKLIMSLGGGNLGYLREYAKTPKSYFVEQHQKNILFVVEENGEVQHPALKT